MLKRFLLAAALFAIAGTASAEKRYFEYTGTVIYTTDASLMPVGAPVRGSFAYDTDSPDLYNLQTVASYQIDGGFLSQTVDGHTVVSDRLGVTVGDEPNAGDVVFVDGYNGIMIDSSFYAEGFFSLVFSGDSHALSTTKLPKSYDLSKFNKEHYGEIYLVHGQPYVQFSIDSVTSILCDKQHGLVDKHCKAE